MHASALQRDRILAYAVVFGSPAGQLVLDDLTTQLDGLSYTKGDALHMAWLEGHRAALAFIRARLALAFDPGQLEAVFQPAPDEETPHG
jgi:hypothetical protein